MFVSFASSCDLQRTLFFCRRGKWRALDVICRILCCWDAEIRFWISVQKVFSFFHSRLCVLCAVFCIVSEHVLCVLCVRTVPEEMLTKYEVKLNNAILAEPKHLPM